MPAPANVGLNGQQRLNYLAVSSLYEICVSIPDLLNTGLSISSNTDLFMFTFFVLLYVYVVGESSNINIQ